MKWAMTLLSVAAWTYIGYRIWFAIWPADPLIAICGAVACANVVLKELGGASK